MAIKARQGDQPKKKIYKKFKPLDLRPKKTRAIRRRLSKVRDYDDKIDLESLY